MLAQFPREEAQEQSHGVSCPRPPRPEWENRSCPCCSPSFLSCQLRRSLVTPLTLSPTGCLVRAKGQAEAGRRSHQLPRPRLSVFKSNKHARPSAWSLARGPFFSISLNSLDAHSALLFSSISRSRVPQRSLPAPHRAPPARLPHPWRGSQSPQNSPSHGCLCCGDSRGCGQVAGGTPLGGAGGRSASGAGQPPGEEKGGPRGPWVPVPPHTQGQLPS